MLDVTLSALIVSFCTALVIYWASRAAILLHGSEDEITKTLEHDLRRGHGLFLGLRSIFVPPVQLAG